MLIPKGKFPIFKSVAALLALLLMMLSMGGGPAVASEVKSGARAPDVVAAEFYSWYLEALSADQDPLSDRYDTFTRYVAKELAARLVERLQGGKVPHSDYFTQAASYRPGWLRSVRAATMRQRAGAADVLVTLGKSGDGDDDRGDHDNRGGGAHQVLALSMVLENSAWKIRQVTAMDAARSSPEQPGI
jgi:hypothetical protein